MSIAKRFLTFSSLTLVSRILGVIRDSIISKFLGATNIADAFFVAFRIPNLFRMFFAEGAMSSAFIPIYTEKIQISEESAQNFISEIFSKLLIILIILSFFSHLFMKNIVSVFAPGFIKNPEKIKATVVMAQIMFPYIILITLSSLVGAALQVKNKFAPTAIMPSITNIAFIIGPFLFLRAYKITYILSYGFVLSGLLQLLYMLFVARKNNIRIQLKFSLKFQDCKKFFQILIPTIIGNSATRINVIISTLFASMYVGSVSYLYYADRIRQLPNAIIGIAMGYVLLPKISKNNIENNKSENTTITNNAIKFCIILCVPVSIAFWVLPKEIVITLFGFGKFSQNDITQTSNIIKIFAIGLPANILSNVIMPLFFANSDTKTPAKISFICMFVNIVICFVLCPKLKHNGVAIAISFSAWINFILLSIIARRKELFVPSKCIQTIANKSMICGAIMTVFILIMSSLSDFMFTLEYPYIQKLIALLSMCLISFFVYIWSLQKTKTIDIKKLSSQLFVTNQD